MTTLKIADNSFMFTLFMFHPFKQRKRQSVSQYVCERVCVCVTSVHVSPLGPFHASSHQAGEDGHHHFLVNLHQVLGQGVDFGSDLPRH